MKINTKNLKKLDASIASRVIDLIDSAAKVDGRGTFGTGYQRKGQAMSGDEEVIEMEEGSEAFNAIGNSNLGPHRNNSVRKEHFLLRRELRRLGIRKARQYEPEKLVKQ